MEIKASQCEIRDISSEKDLVNKFLDNNHNNINYNYTIAYGIFCENGLLQVILFGKPRFDKDFSYELLCNPV